MEILIQKHGPRYAVPQKYLKNESECYEKTIILALPYERKKLLDYLKTNAIEVNTYSRIEVELKRELFKFTETGVMDFKIYKHNKIYGFNAVIYNNISFYIRAAYYEVKTIDTQKPWFLVTVTDDKEKNNFVEKAENIYTNENNRITNL